MAPPRRRAAPADDEPVPPPIHEPAAVPRRQPANAGTGLGVVGILLFLASLFLPWYTVKGRVDNGPYATAGFVDLVQIDGLQGIVVNKILTGGTGTAPVVDMGIPIGLIFVIGAVLSLVAIARATTARQRGRRFLRGGLVTLLPLVVLLLIVNRLSGLLPSSVPAALLQIIKYIGAHPFGGEITQTFLEYQQVTLQWGMEIGGYLLVGSAVLQLVAALIEMGDG